MEFLYEDVMMVRLIKYFMKEDEKEFGSTFGDTLVKGSGFKSTQWFRLLRIWKTDENKKMATARGKFVRHRMNSLFSFSLYLTGGDRKLVWLLFCILEFNAFPFNLPYRRSVISFYNFIIYNFR